MTARFRLVRALFVIALTILCWSPAGSRLSAAELKPACRGLMTSGWGGLPPANLPFVECAAVNVPWSALETADQRFDGPGWEKIEAARRRGLRIRLRIFCGIHAPDFVKRLGGVALSDPEHKLDAEKSGGVAIWNEFSKRGGVTACFWRPEVMDQYEQLMTEVARRYEDAPEVCEVVDSACMTVFAEPFYRAHGNAASNARLHQAGLNLERDEEAHKRAIQIHDRLFRKTRTSLAVNAWDIVDDSPSHHHTSWKETRDFVDWARQRMGQRLVLQNNGFWLDSEKALKQDPATSHLAYLYSVAGPKGFQPRLNPQSDDQVFALIDLAVRFRANFMEFGSFRTCDPDRLRKADRQLKNNP
jgi:hypothetical protein